MTKDRNDKDLTEAEKLRTGARTKKNGTKKSLSELANQDGVATHT